MAAPITRVVDADGRVLHDCREAGCEVSWDGYDLRTGERVDGATDPGDEWNTERTGRAQLTE